nr:nitrogenase component 1 [uncultured Anaeromusa sp.]
MRVGKADWLMRKNETLWQGASAFFEGISDVGAARMQSLWCYFYACGLLERQGLEGLCREEAVMLASDELLPRVAVRTLQSYQLLQKNRNGSPELFARGYRSAAAALFQTLPLQERREIFPNQIAVLGYSVSCQQDVEQFAELSDALMKIGVSVRAAPGCKATLADIVSSTRVQLNVVGHEELGGALARYLEREYGIPWLNLPLQEGLTRQAAIIAAGLTVQRKKTDFAS